MFEDDDERIYVVVRNEAGQYSIWPADRQPPAGWADMEVRGVKSVCLAHIEEVWTDLQPAKPRGAA